MFEALPGGAWNRHPEGSGPRNLLRLLRRTRTPDPISRHPVEQAHQHARAQAALDRSLGGLNACSFGGSRFECRDDLANSCPLVRVVGRWTLLVQV